MVCDLLRVPKKHRMYFDNAKTVFSDVVWYPSPPGAETFPFPILFTSETWDDVHWFCPGAGEDDRTPSSWYNGKMPGPFKGTHFCGKPEWWQNGCPSDAPLIPNNAAGLPVCCFAEGAYSTAYEEAWDVFRSR